MTRLLQPPEEGWRGRFTFIKQILRSAFRVPDETDRNIRIVLDRIEGGAGKGAAHMTEASAVSDRSESGGQAREPSRRR